MIDILNILLTDSFWAASLRIATPLIFGVLGALICERSGTLNLGIEGILLTMYDTRLRLANQVVEEVRVHFQDLVLDTVVHRNTRLGEAPSHGESIILHDATCKGSVNYLNLAREVLQKNEFTQLRDEEKFLTDLLG